MNRGVEHCSNKMSDRMPNTRPVKMSMICKLKKNKLNVRMYGRCHAKIYATIYQIKYHIK
jgi:hypothetical protein